MLSLQRLVAFKAVCDLGSITEAARQINYTQSAVSQHVGTLEDELGVTLLVRKPRGVAPTAAGRLLYEHAGVIIDALEKAKREIHSFASIESGTLRLGSFATAAAAIVPRATDLYRQQFPGVSVEIVEGDPEESLQSLQNGDVDLALVFDYEVSPVDPDLPFDLTHVMDDSLYLAVPSHHRLANRKTVSVAELAEEKWIDGSACSCKAFLRDQAARAGFEPIIGYRTDNYSTIQGMIAAGMGVSFMPGLVAYSLIPGVTVLKVKGGSSARRIYVATPTEFAMPSARAMVEFLVCSAREWTDARKSRRRSSKVP